MALVFAAKKGEQENEADVLQEGLNRHNEQSGMPGDYDLGCYCYEENKLVGGSFGQVVGDRLLVKLLWVEEAYRKRNIATQLMTRLEKQAADNKCILAFVTTYSFEAPEFYKKRNYDEVARITEYFPGHDRIFYRKELA